MRSVGALVGVTLPVVWGKLSNQEQGKDKAKLWDLTLLRMITWS